MATSNSNVIDVEMALPADDGPTKTIDGTSVRKVAPRMDIVALEHGDTERPRIAFYEAKLLSNPELRNDKLDPRIFEQLKAYEAYVTRQDRRTQILEAYRNTAVFLAELGKMRGKAVNPLIEKAATEGNLDLDPTPRVVIFGYEPLQVGEGSSWVRHGDALSAKAKVFMSPRAADVRLLT